MRRLRWFEPEPKVLPATLPWSSVALITASLFLNIAFWMERALLWMPGGLASYSALLVLGAYLIVSLFFVAPALASHSTRRPLFNIIESSFGTAPAVGIRIICICFLVTWVANLVSYLSSRGIAAILKWDSSLLKPAAISIAAVAFLFITGAQSSRTNTRLALFTNTLGFAILIAALIRVREGVPIAFHGFSSDDAHPQALMALHSLSFLAFAVGPLMFLAADFGHRMQTRGDIALAGGVGLALPLAATVFLAGIIGLATHASHYYQPSLEPTVAMALWANAAERAIPVGVVIAMTTIFGAACFGSKTLINLSPVSALGHRPLHAWVACLCGAIAWCSLRPFDPNLSIVANRAAAFCVVLAAVLTADFVRRGSRPNILRRIDWVASCALAVGLATFYFIRRGVSNPWWEPGLFPSYAVAFATCRAGRALQQKST